MWFALKVVTTAQTESPRDRPTKIICMCVILEVPECGDGRGEEGELFIFCYKLTMWLKLVKRRNFGQIQEKDTNQTTHGQQFPQFLEKIFDTFNNNICVCNFVLPQCVHQHYLEMVCFFCHSLPSTQFPLQTPAGSEEEKGMREEENASDRWMHWGMKEAEGRNQGCYK